VESNLAGRPKAPRPRHPEQSEGSAFVGFQQETADASLRSVESQPNPSFRGKRSDEESAFEGEVHEQADSSLRSE
jgi:hypothetical protein